MSKGNAIPYSQEELATIKRNCTLPTQEQFQTFQELFNRPDVSFKNFNALRKRKGWLTGRTGRFKKGHIPSPNAKPKGPNTTSFKKGNSPQIGSQLAAHALTKKAIRRPRSLNHPFGRRITLFYGDQSTVPYPRE